MNTTQISKLAVFAILFLSFSAVYSDEKENLTLEAIHQRASKTLGENHQSIEETISASFGEKAADYQVKLIGLMHRPEGVVYHHSVTPKTDVEVSKLEDYAQIGHGKDIDLNQNDAQTPQKNPIEVSTGNIEILHASEMKTFEALDGFGFGRHHGAPKVKDSLIDISLTKIDSQSINNQTGDITVVVNQEPALVTTTTEPDKIDQQAIEFFKDNPLAAPLVTQNGLQWIAHGPVTASATRCIKCHEVKKDTLLGLFRYEFNSRPLTSLPKSLVRVD